MKRAILRLCTTILIALLSGCATSRPMPVSVDIDEPWSYIDEQKIWIRLVNETMMLTYAPHSGPSYAVTRMCGDRFQAETIMWTEGEPYGIIPMTCDGKIDTPTFIRNLRPLFDSLPESARLRIPPPTYFLEPERPVMVATIRKPA